jgi:hypothetical protein
MEGNAIQEGVMSDRQGSRIPLRSIRATVLLCYRSEKRIAVGWPSSECAEGKVNRRLRSGLRIAHLVGLKSSMKPRCCPKKAKRLSPFVPPQWRGEECFSNGRPALFHVGEITSMTEGSS